MSTAPSIDVETPTINADPGPGNSQRGRPARSVLETAKRILQSSLLILVVLVLWQVIVWVFNPPTFLLPSPGSVLTAAFSNEFNWTQQILVTATEILGGFGVAAVGGILLGVAIAWSPLLSRIFLPPLILFNTLPKVALAPLFLIYLGYGILPNIVIAALIAFFPVVINTSIGLIQTDEDIVDLGRSLDAPKWKIFFRLRLPSAVPYILSALKVATTMAVTGAVFGEFIASQQGLGNLIIGTQVSLRTEVALASLLWLSVLGMALYYAVELVGRLLFPWADRRSA